MPINAYLNFDGNCEEAVLFYASVFETKPPKLLRFGDMPTNPAWSMPEEAKPLIAHTNLIICESMVMFSDLFPGMELKRGNQITLAVVTGDEAAIKRYYHLLSEGATIEMELQQTDWSPCYASLIDRFGIHWQLNCQPKNSIQ